MITVNMTAKTLYFLCTSVSLSEKWRVGIDVLEGLSSSDSLWFYESFLKGNLHKWEEPAKLGPFILSNELKQQSLDICSAPSREVG